MPMILLSKSDEEYLQKCATQLNFAYGIIIGQVSDVLESHRRLSCLTWWCRKCTTTWAVNQRHQILSFCSFPTEFNCVLQRAEPGKYVIVHLAKNGEEEIDFPVIAGSDEGSVSHGPQKVEDIDLQALSNQWLSAIKMIPGSFQILGKCNRKPQPLS